MAGLAQAKRCCVYVKPEKVMHCISPELFDCCADPVVHLLLLKSSMVGQSNCDSAKLTEATSSTRILI